MSSIAGENAIKLSTILPLSYQALLSEFSSLPHSLLYTVHDILNVKLVPSSCREHMEIL